MRRGPGLRWLAAGLLTLLALGLAGLTVAAQLRPARLVSTDPPAGARLTTAPAAVTLTFNGPLDGEQTHVWLVGPGGAFAATGAPRYRGDGVELPVTIVGDGHYRVGYHAQLATGQTATGVVPFTVAAGLVAPSRAAPAVSPPVTAPPDGSAGGGHHGGTGGAAGLALLLAPVVTGAVLLVLMARGRRDRAGDDGPPGSAADSGPGGRRRAWVLREPEDAGDRPADREPARPGG
ncbi:MULTISPECIES: copper resistance CopC family protein [unclassified Micromonospora]|uniref:copper resistance CopC family protein n=1 Tax=unclassified Micromonospora TaxID=2617518 RepID=UPI001B39C9CD|nr:MULTISPECIES: copper resistance CopC family protein [unclassified Micromonospora]MBQ1044337.1 copper resistance protein CopC [Micromonospora sp. C72]MBQ1056841.1 copper resistance protein CopC [Micromonospora sp. C32]